MRRVFSDTTAIALCLAIGMPHIALAEPVKPQAGIRLAQADTTAPEAAPDAAPAEAPAADAADAVPPKLPPKSEAAAAADKAADEAAAAAEDAKKAAEAKSEADAAESAASPAKADTAAEDAAKAADDAASKAAEAAAAADTAASQADTAPAPNPEADAAATESAAAAADAAEAASAADKAADDAAEAEDAAADAAPATAPTDSVPPPVTPPKPAGETPDAKALEEALKEDAAPEAKPATADTTAPTTKPAAPKVSPTPDAKPSTADTAAPTDKPAATPDATAPAAAPATPDANAPATAPDAAALEDALKKAQDAEATVATTPGAAPTTPLATATAPATTPPATTPASAEATAPVIDEQTGKETVAVPEENSTLTDAAKAAAAAAAAPVAAALLENATGTAPAQEVKITDANARSSADDFDSSVSADDQKRTERRERNQDIAKIAVAGLTGLAVGKILSDRSQVALNTGDRVVVTAPDGSQQVLKDDNALLFRPGSTVNSQDFADGSSRTVVTREDGSQVVTIRDANMRVLRRTVTNADGTTVPLIDDTANVRPVEVSTLPPAARPIVVSQNQPLSESELRDALRRESAVDRRFTLGQIRDIAQVRALVAPIDVNAITFDTGSAAIKPDQAQQLAGVGKAISDMIKENPREIFMVEGYTDTVGSAASNLALSDRRAESVALALTEYFNVPPENMVVQGYGEQYLRVPTDGDVRANRRASLRRITDLLEQ